jgi:mono/diheme cytochrome c family protein
MNSQLSKWQAAIILDRPIFLRDQAEEMIEIEMPRGIVMILAGMLLMSAPKNVFATGPSGAQEYKDHCARCHGPDAKGNGPDANEKPDYRPADLTQIAKRHHGRFPREKIYDIIDGGKRLPGHYDFNSPMPLWGLNFQLAGKEYTEASEAAVRSRINALLDYLESIQER